MGRHWRDTCATQRAPLPEDGGRVIPIGQGFKYPGRYGMRQRMVDRSTGIRFGPLSVEPWIQHDPAGLAPQRRHSRLLRRSHVCVTVDLGLRIVPEKPEVVWFHGRPFTVETSETVMGPGGWSLNRSELLERISSGSSSTATGASKNT